MLSLLYRIGTESRRRRRRVDRRLRAEAAGARLDPSLDLRRRTIAALNDIAHDPAPAASPPTARPAYALAFAALLVLAVLAVRFGVTDRAGPPPVAEPPAILAGFDPTGFDGLIKSQLRGLDGPWESSLRTEAKLIATDARNAGEYVLASLPLPGAWNRRSVPGR